jgi:DNA-binding transcriptional ArsR family regulator
LATDGDIQDALVAIHSRLGTIEGRVTLIARSEREELLAELEKVVLKRPIVGQIYLALDGVRNQNEVYALLDGAAIDTSLMVVSRDLRKMHTEHGIVELVSAGRSKVYRKGEDSEDVLNLSANVRKWLKAAEAVDPAPPPGRRRRKR